MCPHKCHFQCFPNRKFPRPEHRLVLVQLVPLELEDRLVPVSMVQLVQLVQLALE
jgi:hypothetical protein